LDTLLTSGLIEKLNNRWKKEKKKKQKYKGGKIPVSFQTMPPDARRSTPPPPSPLRRHRLANPSQTTSRSRQPPFAQAHHSQPCSPASRSAWERFFLDSPPPPPRHGRPCLDEVDWVPATPDPDAASPDLAPA